MATFTDKPTKQYNVTVTGLPSPSSSLLDRSRDSNANVLLRPLHRPAADTAQILAIDILAVSIWSGFLVFALILWTCNGKQTPTMSASEIASAALPLSTIFTIFFAASVGRSVRSYTLWQLQKGGTVTFIDRLIGSTSVSSTIMTNLTTGFSKSGLVNGSILCLFLLWGFSPLGSQAILRIVTVVPANTTTPLERKYLNLSSLETFGGLGNDDSTTYDMVAPKAIMNTALMGSLADKNAPYDLWGNVKIPMLPSTVGKLSDSSGWVDVEKTTSDGYSSLTGIPIGKLPAAQGASSDVTIQSWYWTLECDPWTSVPFTLQNINTTTGVIKEVRTAVPDLGDWTKQFNFNITTDATEGVSVGNAAYVVPVYAPITFWHFEDSKNFTSTKPADHFFRVSNYCNQSCTNICEDLPHRTIGFVLRDSDSFYRSKCTINQANVEIEIKCEDDTYHAHRIRVLDPNLSPPSGWSILDACIDLWPGWPGPRPTSLTKTAMSNVDMPNVVFSRYLANAFEVWHDTSNAISGYITDPVRPFKAARSQRSTKDSIDNPVRKRQSSENQLLADIPDELITSRLAQVMNTFWISVMASDFISGQYGDNFEAYNGTGDIGSAGFDTAFFWNETFGNAIATVTTISGETLVCNILWLSLFTFATVVGLVSSILGLVFVIITKGPRLSFNVSSMMRDNRYCQDMDLVKPVASYMDDDERSQRMGNVRIRLKDVREGEFGHVAVGVDKLQGEVMGRLREDRLYD